MSVILHFCHPFQVVIPYMYLYSVRLRPLKHQSMHDCRHTPIYISPGMARWYTTRVLICMENHFMAFLVSLSSVDSLFIHVEVI
jgi:hypothetical protein